MKHSDAMVNSVSRETRQRLQIYVDLLLRWNKTINLISRNDEATVWERHVADALQLLPLIPATIDAAVDLGSGGGIPGLVLSVASGTPFHLIEADHRKAAFLREAARLTGAPCTIHPARMEAVRLPGMLLVTARALAPLTTLIALALPFMAANATLLALKGSNAEAELTDARAHWHMNVARSPSITNPAATILKITEVSRVGQ
jgi:16S rRNA (guanine527-N7)-methyltransferase